MAMLSSKMRDVLIDHLDGAAVPIIKISELSGLDASRAADRHLTTRALILRGFLKHNSNRAKAPTHTLITEAGRAELAALLGEYADAIVRARLELPPVGEHYEALPAAKRRQEEFRKLAGAVDIPGEAHILGGRILPPAEGAADGDDRSQGGPTQGDARG